MDFDPALYHKTASDVIGPINQLIDILHQHLDVPKNEFVLQFVFAAKNN